MAAASTSPMLSARPSLEAITSESVATTGQALGPWPPCAAALGGQDSRRGDDSGGHRASSKEQRSRGDGRPPRAGPRGQEQEKGRRDGDRRHMLAAYEGQRVSEGACRHRQPDDQRSYCTEAADHEAERNGRGEVPDGRVAVAMRSGYTVTFVALARTTSEIAATSAESDISIFGKASLSGGNASLRRQGWRRRILATDGGPAQAAAGAGASAGPGRFSDCLDQVA